MKDDRIAQLTNLAETMKGKLRIIEELQTLLERTKSEYDNLSSREIPMLMAELGFKQFTLDDGTFFAVVPVLKVTAPKDKMNDIDEWLTEHGHGGMVRTKLDLELPKASNKLPEVIKALNRMGVGYEVSKTIHFQTLNKWGREMESEGMVIPEELFTVWRSNKTIIE